MSNKVVGVLGGGQLGRMMAYAAHRLGISLRVLDPQGADSPAGQVASQAVAGDFNDAATVQAFAQGCDVVTVEIEHVSVAGLEALELRGCTVHPSAATIRTIQDKFRQHQFFAHHGLRVADFREVRSAADIVEAAKEWGGFPVVVKAKTLAYDGRGNVVVRSEEEAYSSFAELGKSLQQSRKDVLSPGVPASAP